MLFVISVHLSNLLLAIWVACSVFLGQIARHVCGNPPLLLLFALRCTYELRIESVVRFFLHLEGLPDCDGANFVGDVSWLSLTPAARFPLKYCLSVHLRAGVCSQKMQTLSLGDHDGVVLGWLLVFQDAAYLLILIGIRVIFLAGDLLAANEFTCVHIDLLPSLFNFSFV